MTPNLTLKFAPSGRWDGAKARRPLAPRYVPWGAWRDANNREG